MALPEEEPALELEADGTLIQKVFPKGKHSSLQRGLIKFFDAFAEPRRIALALPELRTVFGGAAYVPDLSVYRWERIAWTSEGEVPDDFTEPPDIAIEIVSPGRNVTWLVRRCIWYVDHGVTLALLIVLPEFQATVEQLFAALRG